MNISKKYFIAALLCLAAGLESGNIPFGKIIFDKRLYRTGLEIRYYRNDRDMFYTVFGRADGVHFYLYMKGEREGRTLLEKKYEMRPERFYELLSRSERFIYGEPGVKKTASSSCRLRIWQMRQSAAREEMSAGPTRFRKNYFELKITYSEYRKARVQIEKNLLFSETDRVVGTVAAIVEFFNLHAIPRS